MWSFIFVFPLRSSFSEPKNSFEIISMGIRIYLTKYENDIIKNEMPWHATPDKNWEKTHQCALYCIRDTCVPTGGLQFTKMNEKPGY